MDEFDATTYGERIASIYDELYPTIDKGCSEFLCERASGGRALELGIGTGRVALPLSQSGVEVHGIDASESMLARLKEKPGAEQIITHLGSFEAFDLGMKFDLVYAVFNTFYALLSQAAQVSCFSHVARHLQDDGEFVLEVFVPDPKIISTNPVPHVRGITEGGVRLDVALHDALNQQITSQLVLFSEEGTQFYPVRLRYAWPSELDLMAALAGMTLDKRWGSWQKDEFRADSGKHISVYSLGRSGLLQERR